MPPWNAPYDSPPPPINIPLRQGPSPPPPPKPRKKKQPPQEDVRDFWKTFNTKHPGKVTTILPDNPYARSKAATTTVGVVQGQKAVKSYNEAREECKRDVARIAKECRRVNQKYRDPHFDIELDLKMGHKNCLFGLNRENSNIKPKGVKRVTEIFENPQFYVDKATAGDVRQGGNGDCWLMAALCTLGNKEGLIDRVCVARDQEVGIYGFVFHRDGEWQQCIIDDKLYLRLPDYEESVEERKVWNNIDRKSTEEEYIKAYQTGSRALYFASCSDENETWLPLLEKAFAKLHGDYLAIESGFVGEAVEDLTGGVTSEIFSADILDKDRFWKEELSKVNQDFLFGCSTGHLSGWLDPNRTNEDVRGIIQKHAYGIVDAKEIKGEKLVKLRNPWGESEWTGAWSDGSKQWNKEWIELLNHEFGNDGVFWMSYKDLLKKYQHFDRTRLFDRSWTITQQWTTLNIPWSADYHSTKFTMTLKKQSPVVIVLSQLDVRYFKDLEGQYRFTLQFRVQKDGDGENDYIVRSHGNIAMKRSVSTDITLDEGTYSVLMKISATRDDEADTQEEVIRDWASEKPEKLIQLGLSYDLAHAKGQVVETAAEKKEREEYEKKKKEAAKIKLREKIEKERRRCHETEKKKAARNRRFREKENRIRQRRAVRANANNGPIFFESTDGARGSDAGDAGAAYATGNIQRTGAGDVAGDGPQRQQTSTSPEAAAIDESNAPQIVTEAVEGETPSSITQETAPVVEKLESVVALANAQTSHPESIQVNGETVITDLQPLPTPVASPVEEELGEGLESDADSDNSYPDFEFDSEIDMPRSRPQSLASFRSRREESDFGGDSDPWNAVCVVGLRVYSQVKDADITLQVVRPKNEDDNEAVLDRDDPAKGFVRGDSLDQEHWEGASSRRSNRSSGSYRMDGRQ